MDEVGKLIDGIDKLSVEFEVEVANKVLDEIEIIRNERFKNQISMKGGKE